MQNFIKIFRLVYDLSIFFAFCLGTFSKFEPRQNLDQCQMTFDNLLGVMMGGIWQSICLDLVNSNVYAKFYQNIPKGSRDRARFTFFSEFEPRQNLDQSQMTFDNLLGYILSIQICTRNFITIFHSVQEIGPFSLFQNLELGKVSTDDKYHFAISWGLELVNINVYAKVYQNIPNCLRVIDIFTNSPVTKFSQTVRCQMFDYRAHSESQPSASVDFLRVVQSLKKKRKDCRLILLHSGIQLAAAWQNQQHDLCA